MHNYRYGCLDCWVPVKVSQHSVFWHYECMYMSQMNSCCCVYMYCWTWRQVQKQKGVNVSRCARKYCEYPWSIGDASLEGMAEIYSSHAAPDMCRLCFFSHPCKYAYTYYTIYTIYTLCTKLYHVYLLTTYIPCLLTILYLPYYTIYIVCTIL